MDLPNASSMKIQDEIKKLSNKILPLVETSAKQGFGIEELVNKISLFVKRRENVDSELKFIILGFSNKKGLGELLNIGIISGEMRSNSYISETVKVKQIISLNGIPLKSSEEGQIVQILLNITPTFELGTKYLKGKFLSPKISGSLSEIRPSKEYYITIDDPIKFKIALDVIEKIKKIIPNFEYYFQRNEITVQVLGDLQFDFLKERLEDLIEFEITGSKMKGIITINKMSKGKHGSASVRIVPRIKNKLTITRDYERTTKLVDVLGASAAYDAFNLNGLHVEIISGKNEEDIAQAITHAIEKVKILKIIPAQDIIVRVENYYDLYQLLNKYEIEILFESESGMFYLQVKNENFESFFNALMKISKGRADLSLVKFDFEDKILAVDPGMRHFGFCLIERNELPSLWYVNLKKSLTDKKIQELARKQIRMELNTFLDTDKELINKIFIGNGPGSDFIIDFFIQYFNIPQNETHRMNINNNNNQDRFIAHPEMYFVDEFKTTKEAMFHLQKGEVINEVYSKGFVDHAIAALLIARRGIKGEVVNIQRKPMKQLHDYIIENYAGSFSFSGIHNINSLEDLKSGMYLRVRDSSKLDSNLINGDIISFIGFGTGYSNFHAINLSGNKIIVKFDSTVKIKRDFFKVFSPVKERN